MSTINLTFNTTTQPDFGGFRFFVEAGDEFDADDYAEAYRLNRPDIDAQDIHAAQDAAARLNPGEWLEVTHDQPPQNSSDKAFADEIASRT